MLRLFFFPHALQCSSTQNVRKYESVTQRVTVFVLSLRAHSKELGTEQFLLKSCTTTTKTSRRRVSSVSRVHEFVNLYRPPDTNIKLCFTSETLTYPYMIFMFN